ncbi:MAG: PKD domain-containing protein [Saprospiraceae bacterium]|nr:PKD domain-containing protein [Saprospiraceae bacterium]
MNATSHTLPGKSKGIENSLLSILFIAGILGAFYFLRQSGEMRQSSADETFTTDQLSVPAMRSTEDYLTIEGAMEEHIPMKFFINAYNEQVQYELDFGNGERRVIAKPLTTYAYKKSGTFRVRLTATFNGSEKILFSGRLYISSSSEVAGY